ncbi:type IV pilin biogenesis protein [Shewanella yunxiaonensis]|uniref:Type IV pilin biogenesis protein n=1 Tax=Shewanella yunxiaonensis TaxID=2829809 RepID=A0ABX7YRV4_9GAMM|nr:PilC/PilY family type IV pilus protein [Shewanella yunxiaonensis]QUN04911.1 type IV pilin biogenesis protein [Shewanella yunxiaonensis]
MKKLKFLIGVVVASMCFLSAFSYADDTELYQIDASVSGHRPQVLIIFDNSGSMSTEEENAVNKFCGDSVTDGSTLATSCAAFDKYLETYKDTYTTADAIYWNAGGIDNSVSSTTPNDPNDARRFEQSINNCGTARKALLEKGRWTGYLIQNSTKKSDLNWSAVNNDNGLNTSNVIVDCVEDIENDDTTDYVSTGSSTPYSGYPANVTGHYSKTNKPDATTLIADTGATLVTLYSYRYLAWYTWVTTTDEGQNSGTTETRLDVAKEAITSALGELGDKVDAGLAVFNLDYPNEGDRDGGRIVYPITHMTSANQSSLISLIDGMPAQTNTPLCETLYEAYQYFSGGPVVFGNKDTKFTGTENNDNLIQDYTPNDPPNVFGDGPYTSPFKKCQETAYIIYITDGAPTLDKSADGLIKTLTSGADGAGLYTEYTYTNTETNKEEQSYLPALASYMYNNDLVSDVVDQNGTDHKQNVQTFTIGFSAGADAAAALLNETAIRGGNLAQEDDSGNLVSKGYYKATTDLDLSAAIVNALKSILTKSSTYTSPSIATNNFDKTQTLNSAYYAMFLPDDSGGPRWSGNLKKLKVSSSGVLYAQDSSVSAINDDGNIRDDVCTFWSDCSAGKDGNSVKMGGAIQSLMANYQSRNIITNTAANNAMQKLNAIDTSLIDSSGNYTDTYLANTIKWLYGYDVDDDDGDGDTSEPRKDIMGDPLHSKPLAIDFGTDGAPNVKIILGTNQGLVHMFTDNDSANTISEDWAFIPKELLPNLIILRKNYSDGGAHGVYGMDLSPVSYVESYNTNGSINNAIVYMGMRRGGTSYYALNVTASGDPSLRWKIDSNSTGFEDMGDSWSEPTVTEIPGYVDSKGINKPVLIFGGGMDSSDGTGQEIYIADALTGEHIYTFSTSDGTASVNSVVTKVAALDSNNDGITDRLYASDIAGNVWRMDMPSTDTSTWGIYKFASLDGGSGRMFFAEPTVAQTQFSNIITTTTSTGTVTTAQTIPYDAVTLGSGNRTHPLDTDTQDMYFMLQDRNVVTQNFTSTPSTITISDLVDVSSSAISASTDMSSSKGWYYDYTDTGEKTLSASLIYNGKVYFTSYIPPVSGILNYDTGVCDSGTGQARLYVFDLHRGTRSYSSTYYDIGTTIPDTPQIVVPDPGKGNVSQAYIIGVGKGECTNGTCTGTINLGSGLTTNRIYYHINENQ